MTANWTSNDSNELVSLVEDLYKKDQTAKLDLARTWEQNIRFINGDQYIKYSKTQRGYVPIPDRVDEEFIPRGNDNQIYPRTDILRSNLTREAPVFDVTANSGDSKDKRAAKVALAVDDALREINHDRIVNGEAAEWAIATGNSFVKTAWMPGKLIPAINPDGTEQIDQNGKRVMIPLGDIKRTSVSPFQIGVNEGCLSILPGSSTARVIFQYSKQKLSDVKSWYGSEGNGYTGQANLLTAESCSDNILKIDQDLQQATVAMYSKSETAISVSDQDVVLKEFYVAPDDGELQFGRMIVVANGKLLYVGESPYAIVDRDKWHPFSHFRYKSIPGNFWGITPITQCIKLQRRLNAIDTMCILHRQTMALGQWLIPKGSVANSSLSGRVGLKIEYVAGANGARPEKVNGTQIGSDIFNERGMVLTALDDMCGTRDIMSGKPPGDIISGVSLELIREQAYSRFNPMYEAWEIFLEHSSQIRLGLVAKKQLENRPEFTAIIRRKLRDLTGLDLQSFVGADLQDNTNLRITAGSTVPRSTASKLAFLQKFGEAGLLGDLVTDPQRNQLFLGAFNIDNFKTDTNVDYIKSQYELGMIETGQGDQVMVDQHDQHEVHMKHFEIQLKDPSFYTSRAPELLQQAWAHYAEHEQMMQQKTEENDSKQKSERDENAYVQSIVNSGGPDGDPPSIAQFPTAIRSKERMNQEQMQEGPPQI